MPPADPAHPGHRPLVEPDEWIEIPLTVGRVCDGFRVDRFLTYRIKRLSRTRIQAIVRAGQLFRAGQNEPLRRVGVRVHTGEKFILIRPAPIEPDVPLTYVELYRDSELLVLDKPAGLPVHPSARYHRNTVTQMLRTQLGPDHGWELAHRLDRETSGVLVLGRRGRGASGSVLKRAFYARQVEKCYWAIVHGRLAQRREIDMDLGPAKGSAVRIKMGPCPRAEGGVSASTLVAPLAYGEFRAEPITLVEARPRTGRQHQIRVHLAEIGHGLVGDKLYGLDERYFLEVVEGGRPIAELEHNLGLSRHALHARALALPHPTTGKRIVFTSAWPSCLAALICPPSDCAGGEPALL
ncbi:MAG: RluA family pseudouridine synthase [Nannocystaceae bacterium]